jgi:pimeloyl-ACP methyl ester carboxylesterase
LEHPGRVRSLALLCTFGRAKDGARLTPWVLWMTLRTRLGSRRARRRAFLEMLFPKGYRPPEGEEALAARVSGLIGRDLADQPPIVMKQVRALSRHDASDRLGRLAGIPTLVVSGELDPIARPEYGRRLAEGIPGATFEVWPGTAHGLMLQQPDELNARLGRFLAEAETAAAARKGPGGR